MSAASLDRTPSTDASAAHGSAGHVSAAQPLAGRKLLIVVENLPLPFDRRVWQEARTLALAGAVVSVICPKGKGHEASYECLDGIHIHRHWLPLDAAGPLGYLAEYGAALLFETLLAWKIFLTRGFDTVQGCNPPDLIFLVALQFRLFGVRFVFDHHDINPELYEAKFGRRDMGWHAMRWLERLTFATAHVSIATNDSYRRIAIERGGKQPEDVFVVRSGPDLARLVPVPPQPSWLNGRATLVGYVGVMGAQEGLDLLIEAVRHIVCDRGRHDIQFCLVGGGPHLETVRALICEQGLGDYVTLTGRVPDATLREVLSTMNFGVNPDRVNPMNDLSTMNKVLEYMAFAKPLVQFDVTEGRVSAQTASLYAKPNDPIDLARRILELADDPRRAQAMGRAGRARVEKDLAWPHQVAPLLAAYQAVEPR